MESEKVLLFHPMQQHSYKTALALKYNNIPFEYWTCIYYSKHRLLYKILDIVLKQESKKRMRQRCEAEIDQYVHVTFSFLALAFLVASRKCKKNFIPTLLRKILIRNMGKKVAKYAMKHNFKYIICYDVWSYGVIKEVKKRKKNIRIILDYSSIYYKKIQKIIDVEKNLVCDKCTYFDNLIKYYKKFDKEYCYEFENADYYLSASSFTDNSLIAFGANPSKIFRTTYGSDFPKQSINDRKMRTNMFTFIYVGKISYSKGSHYLLKAIEQIDESKAKFIFIGQDSDHLMKNYSSRKNIEYVGYVSHDMITNYYKIADAAITASLYDGFSLFLMEAAAYNLPIICTKNTGLADYIGSAGIIVNPFSEDELVSAIKKMILKDNDYYFMKNNVSNILDKLNWGNYYSQIDNCLKSISLIEKGGKI